MTLRMIDYYMFLWLQYGICCAEGPSLSATARCLQLMQECQMTNAIHDHVGTVLAL